MKGGYVVYYCSVYSCPYDDCKFNIVNKPEGDESKSYRLDSSCERITRLRLHEINMCNKGYRRRYEELVESGKIKPFPKLRL